MERGRPSWDAPEYRGEHPKQKPVMEQLNLKSEMYELTTRLVFHGYITDEQGQILNERIKNSHGQDNELTVKLLSFLRQIRESKSAKYKEYDNDKETISEWIKRLEENLKKKIN